MDYHVDFSATPPEIVDSKPLDQEYVRWFSENSDITVTAIYLDVETITVIATVDENVVFIHEGIQPDTTLRWLQERHDGKAVLGYDKTHAIVELLAER